MKFVVTGADRIGLARMKDALTKAGHRIEIATDLADAPILVRASVPEVLIFHADHGDHLAEGLPVLQTLMESHPDLDVILTLPPMPPPDEEQIIRSARSAGIELHLPQRFVIGPHFRSVLTLIEERRALQEQAEFLTVAETEEPPAPQPDTGDVAIPDYTRLWDELRAALNETGSVSLMIVGIDNLEEIEDKRGQDSVEDAIHDLVQLIQADLRDTDVVTRTEYDERLAVVLPMTPAAEAEKVASRIQMKQARRSLGAVSITAGIAEATEGVDVDTLIRRAERAWNQAQRRDDRRAVVGRSPPAE